MARFNDRLDRVKIAAPCNADWDQMFSFEGERVRFCSQCNLNVYNLSEMTRNEANTLLARTEGRLCVRFYRRADGTVLTENCPVGLRAFKRRAAWVAQVLLGMLLSFLGGLGLSSLRPIRELIEHSSSQTIVMGDIGPIPEVRQPESESAIGLLVQIEKPPQPDGKHWADYPGNGEPELKSVMGQMIQIEKTPQQVNRRVKRQAK